MDLLLQLHLLVGMFAFFISYHILINKRKEQQPNKAPEPGHAWPLIGHLHLLRGPKPLHHKLGTLAGELGPVFLLRLGVYPTLVVTGSEAIKECFTVNDRVLASRPSSAMGEIMCYNHLMYGAAPYGPYWREMRKMSILHLLSNSRLEMLRHVRAAEIDARIRELYRRWVGNQGQPVKVEMKNWLNDLTFSVVLKMVVGKGFTGASDDDEEAREFRRLIREFFRMLKAFVVSDVFPFLRWMDWKGRKRTMKRVAGKLDCVIEKYLNEHRYRRAACGKGERREEDFLDVMLSILEDGLLPDHDSDTVIKATALGLVIAGGETTATTLAGALSALVSNPHVLKTAQDELDTHVGKSRHLDESDIKNLAYLQAIIKETLRMSPAGTLLPLHLATQDCQIGGFDVAAGTRIMVDIGRVHQDPLIWPDPHEFRPERWFMSNHRDWDVKGQHFEYIPFGAGRRSCPGISFAMQVMQVTLGRLIQGFEMAVPADAASLDVRESLRLDNPISTPVEIIFTPRLPSRLYDGHNMGEE